jgi:Uma2 family endonuclease
MIVAAPTELIVLGPELNGILMTVDEFDAVTEYDEDYCYELIRGVLIVNPIPSEEESDPNEELGHWIREWRDQHPHGSLLNATLSERYIHLPNSRRRADRVIWVGLNRYPDPRREVPTIVVEFVSAGRRSWLRDYVEKRDEYFALGVVEYWIINRFQRNMTVFRKTEQGVSEQTIEASDVYRPSLLPGFELPLGKLLSFADAWSRRLNQP